jgi:large subunit ribosomal protein L13
MPTPAQKTTLRKRGQVDRQWFSVDASGRVLGRLAARIATVLMGKHRPDYTPYVDCGDFVIVLNCQKVKMTGRKTATKTFQHYTNYPGGQRTVSYADLMRKHPTRIVEQAVRRMLPKNKLAVAMLKKLKLYAGEEHPHAAQQPKPLPEAL